MKFFNALIDGEMAMLKHDATIAFLLFDCSVAMIICGLIGHSITLFTLGISIACINLVIAYMIGVSAKGNK